MSATSYDQQPILDHVEPVLAVADVPATNTGRKCWDSPINGNMVIGMKYVASLYDIHKRKRLIETSITNNQ
jgi:hypothetical protein